MIDFIPRRDTDVLAFTTVFAVNLSADPQSFGVSIDDAQRYVQMQQSFVQAMRDVEGAGTRSPVAVSQKNEARRELVSFTRALARQIHGQIIVSNGQLQSLGLRVFKDHRTRTPPPATSPWVSVVQVEGNRVLLQLRSSPSPGSRVKPENVAGALIYWTSDDPTRDPAAWKVLSPTSATRRWVVLPPELGEGRRVWFTAEWFNRRNQSGPRSACVSTRLGLETIQTDVGDALTTMALAA